MNNFATGPILFVGEGDFSLALSLRKTLPGNIDIFASTLLSESDVCSLHRNSKENIKNLKDLGTNVLYNVDATHLENSEELDGKQFAHIVFNFPHCGGKSNVAKCRTLLQHFFKSAAPRIRDDGSVCVTLCGGQGGTPADGKVRAWNDSWQVVAAATYSHLVLRHMWPFIVTDYKEYGCTGFRSTDRYFHTNSSWTYVFVKVNAIPTPLKPTPIELKRMNFDGRSFEVRPYLASKLSRNLLEDNCNPLSLTRDALVAALTQLQPVRVRSLPLVCPRNVVLTWQQLLRKQQQQQLVQENLDGEQATSSVQENDGDKVEDLLYELKERVDQNTAENVGQSTAQSSCFLRPTLLLSALVADLPQLASETTANEVCVWSGLVGSRHGVDAGQLPVRHELAGVCPIATTSDGRAENTVSEFVHSLERMLSDVLADESDGQHEHKQQDASSDKSNECSDLPGQHSANSVSSKITSSVPLPLAACFDRRFNVYEVSIVSSEYGGNDESLIACNQVTAFGTASVKCVPGRDKNKTADVTPEKLRKVSRVVGYVGTLARILFKKDVETLTAEVGEKESDGDLLAFVLDLDAVTMARYDIPDARLLWCEDRQFCDQFATLTFREACRYKPISLYPPLWRHDLSVWDETGTKLSKRDIIDTAFDIAGDCLKEMHLRDRWLDPRTGGVAWCFREVYQSPLSAVSHDLAHDFQNAIRLTVAKEFNVALK